MPAPKRSPCCAIQQPQRQSAYAEPLFAMPPRHDVVRFHRHTTPPQLFTYQEYTAAHPRSSMPSCFSSDKRPKMRWRDIRLLSPRPLFLPAACLVCSHTITPSADTEICCADTVYTAVPWRGVRGAASTAHAKPYDMLLLSTVL